MATATQSYAATKNARYTNSASNLVDLVQRYNDTVAALPLQAQRNWQAKLAQALQSFKRNHPGLTWLIFCGWIRSDLAPHALTPDGVDLKICL